MIVSTILLFIISIVALLVAVTALVLAILWRSKTDTNPSIPSQSGGFVVTMTPGLPTDVAFVPGSSINYTIVSHRVNPTTIESSILLMCSSIFVTRSAGPMTDINFSFELPESVVGTVGNKVGEVAYSGGGTRPTASSPGTNVAPLAVMQDPLVFGGTGEGGLFTYHLHYTFGGGTVPADQEMQLTFYFQYRFQTTG